MALLQSLVRPRNGFEQVPGDQARLSHFLRCQIAG
jgi:hypothetical protein